MVSLQNPEPPLLQKARESVGAAIGYTAEFAYPAAKALDSAIEHVGPIVGDAVHNLGEAGQHVLGRAAGLALPAAKVLDKGIDAAAPTVERVGEGADKVMGVAGMALLPAAVALEGSFAGAQTGLLAEVEGVFEELGVTAGFQRIFGSNVDTSDEGLEKAFKMVDTDGSGKISSGEMRAYIFGVYGMNLDEGKVSEMMKAADTNRDGEVSLDEFKVMMRAGPAKPMSP